MDSNGKVYADYITDAFLNSMQYKIFVAIGSPYDSIEEQFGEIPLEEYMGSNHEFINRDDLKDIYQNRWLLNDFFEKYLVNDRNKHFRLELAYLDYPKET